VWTGLGDELERSDADIVTLGWLGSGTISIEEIGRLSKPIVWNLSDMWAFSGAEHISDTGRFIEGYRSDNRPAGESGWDRDRATWARKHRSWQRPQWVVTPSRWLADCVRSSALMHEWPTTVIPRPLDLAFWRPATPLDAVRSRRSAVYKGLAECVSADLLSGSGKVCRYGCLGYGNCARICPVNAISLNEANLAVVDPDKCISCGLCVKACPRNLKVEVTGRDAGGQPAQLRCLGSEARP
jgi:ferredoxin